MEKVKSYAEVLQSFKRPKSKFGNKKVRVEIDGEMVTFDSKKEYARWKDLVLAQKSGAIKSLMRQVRYKLKINGLLVCTYVADFVYTDFLTGKQVVEDCKGYKTQIYILKRKLMLAIHGIQILES